MAEIEDGTLIIIEGDKYIMKGNTLVFLKGSEEDGDRRIDEERKASD